MFPKSKAFTLVSSILIGGLSVRNIIYTLKISSNSNNNNIDNGNYNDINISNKNKDTVIMMAQTQQYKDDNDDNENINNEEDMSPVINSTLLSTSSSSSSSSSLSSSPYHQHYLLHIPKTAGYSSLNLFELDVQELFLAENDGNGNNNSSSSSKKQQKHHYWGCNRATVPIVAWTKWVEDPKLKACRFFMTESYYSPLPPHSYTLLRYPPHHVVSQYFHCKESKPHQKEAHLMPKSLDRWLQHWVRKKKRQEKEIQQQQQQQKQQRWSSSSSANYNHHHHHHHPFQYLPHPHPFNPIVEFKQDFRCYNPINMQTKLLRGQLQLQQNDDDNNNINSHNNNNSTEVVVAKVEEAAAILLDRFDAVGITSQLNKSTCVISITMHKKVPQRCNCTASANITSSNTRTTTMTTTTTSQQRRQLSSSLVQEQNHHTQEGTKKRRKFGKKRNNNNNKIRRKNKKNAGGNQDHGVKHHGASFNATARQLRLMEELIDLDMVLYRVAQQRLEEKVKEIEEEYDIVLCG